MMIDAPEAILFERRARRKARLVTTTIAETKPEIQIPKADRGPKSETRIRPFSLPTAIATRARGERI